MRVLITGANGFIGQRLCARLMSAGMEPVAAVRRRGSLIPGVTEVEMGFLDGETDWRTALTGIDIVVHLAAATHGQDLIDESAKARYDAVNVTATERLAAAVADSTVGHFVFMSSIKVNGERSCVLNGAHRAFAPSDVPEPQDNYGKSKLRAEHVLGRFADAGAFELTVLRPPLVYGPGQKGNVLRLMRWIAAGRMLPFAKLSNSRSFVFVDNLADAVVCAIDRQGGKNRVYTLADVDLSTPDLIRAMAIALEVKPRLVSCPVSLLQLCGRLAGKRAELDRLLGSLVVDSTLAQEALGWFPRVPVEQALRETADWLRTVAA